MAVHMNFRYDNWGGGIFTRTLQSKHRLTSDEKRNRINGHSKHDTAKRASNLWPHPNTRQRHQTHRTHLTDDYVRVYDDES